MRILQVCPYDWHSPGGVQTHVALLSAELSNRGHDVLVASPGRRPSSDPRLRILGRPLRVPFNGTVAPVCPSLSAIWRVRRLLHEFQPDICHAHEPFAPSIALWAGAQTLAPLVVTFHAHCDLRIGPALYSLGTWPLNRRAAAGIAVSPAAISCLHARVRVPFRVVPNGVDPRFVALDANRPRATPRRILFAHRLEPRKGFGVMTQAFAQIAAVVPDAQLVVVGDGSDASLVDRLPAALRTRVQMRGSISRDALIDEFAAASVFVAPALNGESFGVVLIEAMAAAVPIVASDIPGYREVLSGSGGVLVPPGQPNALAEAVIRVLTTPGIASGLAVQGRRRAEDFTWERVADAVEDIYAAVTTPARIALKRAAI